VENNRRLQLLLSNFQFFHLAPLLMIEIRRPIFPRVRNPGSKQPNRGYASGGAFS
jgi:hypothetical protein